MSAHFLIVYTSYLVVLLFFIRTFSLLIYFVYDILIIRRKNIISVVSILFFIFAEDLIHHSLPYNKTYIT